MAPPKERRREGCIFDDPPALQFAVKSRQLTLGTLAPGECLADLRGGVKNCAEDLESGGVSGPSKDRQKQMILGKQVV